MSMFVKRFRKVFRLDAYIYWMTERDASVVVVVVGGIRYIPLQIIWVDRRITEETKPVTSYMNLDWYLSDPSAPISVLNDS